MENIYPANPTNIPTDLTKPSGSHKRQVWLAVLGLVAFMVVYLSLTVWFGWSAYSLIYNDLLAAKSNLFIWVIGLSSGFLAVFMVKALLFVKKGSIEQDYEVTAASEPQLFQFLFRLADETGAPRPHRVHTAYFYHRASMPAYFMIYRC